MSKDPEENPVSCEKIYQMKQPVKKLKQVDHMLFSSSADSKVRIWNIQSRTGDLTLDATLKGLSGPATKMKVDRGLLFCLSSRDEVLRAWNIETKELALEFKGHTKYLTDMAIVTKDDIIYTSSFDSTIVGWNLRKADRLITFKGHEDSVVAVKVVGTKIVSASADKTIRIWKRKNGDCIKVLEGHTSFVFGVRVADKMIYSNSQDGTIRVWSFKTGECKKTIKLEGPIATLKLTKRGIFALQSKAVFLIDKDAKEKDDHISFEGHTGSISCFTWYKDVMFTSGADRTIRAWNCKKNKVLTVFRGHTGPANHICVLDSHIYTAGQDGSIRQWSNDSYIKEEQSGWA